MNRVLGAYINLAVVAISLCILVEPSQDLSTLYGRYELISCSFDVWLQVYLFD